MTESNKTKDPPSGGIFNESSSCDGLVPVGVSLLNNTASIADLGTSRKWKRAAKSGSRINIDFVSCSLPAENKKGCESNDFVMYLILPFLVGSSIYIAQCPVLSSLMHRPSRKTGLSIGSVELGRNHPICKSPLERDPTSAAVRVRLSKTRSSPPCCFTSQSSSFK